MKTAESTLRKIFKVVTMVETLYRTYGLQKQTVKWIDKFAEEHNVDKTEVVERAIRVYAIKTNRGDWTDPRFSDKVENKFEDL